MSPITCFQARREKAPQRIGGAARLPGGNSRSIRFSREKNFRSPCRKLAIQYTPAMLFLVVERFKPGAGKRIGERFRRAGRMLPDGVVYRDSWMDRAGTQCFQLMEAPAQDALTPWLERWRDLIDFEIVPVESSAEFWAKARFD